MQSGTDGACAVLSLDDARLKLLQLVSPPAPGSKQTLSPQLLDSVLAEPLRAAQAYPNTARSRMDGYAVRAADIPARGISLPIASTARPADTPGQLAAGTAWRIFTGAPLPEGADTVIMQEQARPQADPPCVFIADAQTGDFVRPAGEDIAADQLLLQAGTQLHGRHLALAAASGAQSLCIYPPLHLGLLRLGSELAAPGTPLAQGQQADLNGLLLTELAAKLHLQLSDFGTVADDKAHLLQKLRDCCQSCDLLVTTGGASVGDQDFLPEVLQSSGEVVFHRVAIRPGMPCIAGRMDQTPVIGLPGNPVSAFVSFRMLLMPCLRKAQGIADVYDRHSAFAPLMAKLEQEATNPLTDRTLLLQAESHWPKHGDFCSVRYSPHQHSALLSPLSTANCLLELAAGEKKAAGDSVRIWPC